MAADRKQLILVDGSGYIFRAFHALPPMNTSHGLPTQAVYGFIRMLLKLLKDVRPSHIAIVFDSPKRTFRDDLFADYKANRSEAPNDLIVQIPYIHRAVEAFRIKSLMIEGFEADDVIGTLAKRAAKEDFVVTLITADKDFMQLVGPHVTLWDTMRDQANRSARGARSLRRRAVGAGRYPGADGRLDRQYQGRAGRRREDCVGADSEIRQHQAALREPRPYRGVRDSRREESRGPARRASRGGGPRAKIGAHRDRHAAQGRARRVRVARRRREVGRRSAARVGVQFDHSRDIAVAGGPSRPGIERDAGCDRQWKRSRRGAQDSSRRATNRS